MVNEMQKGHLSTQKHSRHTLGFSLFPKAALYGPFNPNDTRLVNESRVVDDTIFRCSLYKIDFERPV